MKRTYPEIVEMDVSKTPGCVVGCQSSKIDVKNGLMKRRINKFDVHDVHATNLGKSDTWRSVSKMNFACNLRLLKIAP